MPVIGYQTDEMPAFYTRHSGFPLSYGSQTTEELAAILKAQWSLGLKGGAVIANPIPQEHALDKDFIDDIIEQAMAEAKANGINGKDVTPFLLGKVKELTEGKSLVANIELVKHNAKVGAELAASHGAL